MHRIKVCRYYRNSMESNTFYGEFLVKLAWRLSGSLVYPVFSIKTSANFMVSPYYGGAIFFAKKGY